MPKTSTSFQKGKSGNPNGRPKSEWSWSGVLREVAEQELKGKEKKQWIAESLFQQAVKGNVPAIKEFGDRIDGKAKQNIGLGGQGEDGALEIIIKRL